METSAPLSCTRCGGTLHGVFVGKICPRCLLASVASTSPGPHVTAARDIDLPALATGGEGWRVGMRLEDYELLDVLGSGGMAVVYLARQLSLDRLVALKTIAGSLAGNLPSQERFRREARAVAQLDHPGIVSVHDSGVLGGALFYTMDYVDGPDLGRVLRERSLPPRETAQLMRRVADAVGYAHARGIIHRDLKPANVLLDATGVPRVADFGLAFDARGDGGPTLTGDLLGTPPYMAPEVLASGAKRATPPSDVYSLGAMLFQMLTGRTPFVGENPSEILHLALTAQPPSPRLLNPAVPRDLETICLKCLEKEASGRYHDAAALAEDLGRYLDGEPIHARPVSPPMRLLRWSRRRPALAIFIVALALGTLGATWAAFVINAGRQRALAAESSAREGLWRANLAHAQAARLTTRSGARGEALAALAEAARFRPSLALRNEAIAALCLDEARLHRSWPINQAWQAPVVFDPALETYLAEASPGALVRRSCVDDHEIETFAVPRVGVVGLPVFSPDGRTLAVRYADNVVRVWDAGTARILFELPDTPSPLPITIAQYGDDLAFRPDGKQIAIGAVAGGFTLHAIPGGEEQGHWGAAFRPSIVCFSPDGSQLAVVGRQTAAVHFVDAAKLTLQRSVTLPSVPTCASWTPKGDQLAVGTRASRIHFVAAASGAVVDTISAYENGGVGQIVFSPRQGILAGNGSDEAVSFWSAASGRLLMKFNGVNNQPVLAFNASGTRLGAYDNYTQRASLVEVRSSPIYLSVPPPEPTQSAICSGALSASSDGRWLACGGYGAMRLCDARTGQTLRTMDSKDPHDMMSAQFAPDSHTLLVASINEGLRRVEISADQGGAPILGAEQMLDPETGFQIEGLAEDGRVLLCSEEKAAAKVVDPTRRASPTIRWPVTKITSAAFGPDDKEVLTEAGEPVPGEAAVKVWDISATPPRCTGSFGDDTGGKVQCSRRGGWVVVTGDHKTELWRYGSWQRGVSLPADLQGETHHAQLSPDGATLVIEKDGYLHLVATATGELLATCEPPVSPAGICVNEVFSGDGSRIFLLWQYGSLHFWDVTAMHRELATLGLDWSAGR